MGAFKFDARAWDRRLHPESAIGRIQAAQTVTGYARHRFNVIDAFAIVGLIVAALVALGVVL